MGGEGGEVADRVVVELDAEEFGLIGEAADIVDLVVGGQDPGQAMEAAQRGEAADIVPAQGQYL